MKAHLLRGQLLMIRRINRCSELAKHLQFDLVETAGMTEDQLREIPYTVVETHHNHHHHHHQHHASSASSGKRRPTGNNSNNTGRNNSSNNNASNASKDGNTKLANDDKSNNITKDRVDRIRG